ncbi:MAG: hypothetical protein U9R79_11710 [Armatimonadota bacterium]|nr:hypothetical protein [Armatimonadota bacterium]
MAETSAASLTVALLLAGCLPASAAELGTGPLAITIGPGGAISGVRVGEQNLTAAAAVAEGGFAVRDHRAGEQFAPLRGETAEGRFAVASDEAGVALDASVTRHEQALEIAGTLRSTVDPPRCLTLRFGLPMDLTGWRWHRDLDAARAIKAPILYRNGIPSTWGSGWMDLWPLAAVSNEGATVCLATRIDEPRLLRLGYDGGRKLLMIEFDLGLSEHSEQFAGEVPFRFFLYALGEPTGLRGGLARYYDLFPELFVERTEKMGGWFAWGDIARHEPPLSDYGLMFHESPEAPEATEHDLLLGLVPMPYIEPGMYQLHFGDREERPTREDVLQRLRTYADPEFTGRIWSAEPAATREQEELKRRLCQAVLASGVRDPEGDLLIARIGQFSWVRGSWWAAQLACVLDPDIPQGRGQYLLEHAREHVLENPRMRGAYLDSWSAHFKRCSYAPEHLAAADIPPVFAGDPPQPCVAMPFAAIEYVQALRDLIGEDRVMLPNLYHFAAPYPFHQFDVLGKEHWVAPTGWMMQSFRALGRHKVVTQLPAYEDAETQFLRRMLLYDVFPGGYARRPDNAPVGMREDYRRLLPWLRLLHRLRWQPITGASAEEADLQIERYGQPGGPLVFVIHSPYVGRRAHLRLDARALRIDPGAWCADPLDDEPLSWERADGELRLEAAVSAGDVRMIAVGETADHRRLLRMLAEDRVADAHLCLREYRMRHGEQHPAESLFEMHREALATPWLMGVTEALVGDEPTIARARQLAEAALEQLRVTEDLRAKEPQAVPDPPRGALMLDLPHREDFEQALNREVWDWPDDEPGVRLADGRLELEIARGRSAGLTMARLVDFSAEPLQLDWDFQYNHSGEDYYLMLHFSLKPPVEGSQDVLRIRLDPGIRVRVENGETAPSNFTVSLTDYTPYETNVPHHMTLQIGPERYALWIDGELHGRGAHRLGFTHGRFATGVYSGHGGFGDVCWMDDLRIRRIERLTEEPLP